MADQYNLLGHQAGWSMLTRAKIRGLTLIELMIGIVIVGLLLAFALPSYTTWLHNSQIRTAAESILNGMQLARAEAVRQNTNVQFVLTALPMSDWTVSVVTSPVPPIQTRSSAEGSATARVAASPTGATKITFNSLGRVVVPTNPDGSTTLTEADVTSTVVGATRHLKVRVSGGGMRMCDPDPGLAAATPPNPQSCFY